jgi:hypothetical protein
MNPCTISFSPVTCYPLDLGMGLKPSRNRLGQAVFEHIDGATPLQIDDDRAIVMPCAPGPVIDSDHTRWGLIG